MPTGRAQAHSCLLGRPPLLGAKKVTLNNGIVRMPITHPSAAEYPAPIGWVPGFVFVSYDLRALHYVVPRDSPWRFYTLAFKHYLEKASESREGA